MSVLPGDQEASERFNHALHIQGPGYELDADGNKICVCSRSQVFAGTNTCFNCGGKVTDQLVAVARVAAPHNEAGERALDSYSRGVELLQQPRR